jgi:hypothetical protein
MSSKFEMKPHLWWLVPKLPVYKLVIAIYQYAEYQLGAAINPVTMTTYWGKTQYSTESPPWVCAFLITTAVSYYELCY